MSRRDRGSWAALACLLAVTPACLPPATLPVQAQHSLVVPALLDAAIHLSQSAEIDGRQFYAQLGEKAGPLLPYDIEKVVDLVYADDAQREVLTVRLVLLGSPLEAFGLHQELRESGAAVLPSPLWADGYRQSGDLIFNRDRYLVEMSSGKAGALPADKLLKLAEYLAARMPGSGLPPREVSALQKAGCDPPSILYHPSGILGHPQLARATSGHVVVAPGDSGTAFLLLTASAERAELTFNDLVAFLTSGDRGASYVLGVGELACRLWDKKYGWVNISRRGRLLVGTYGIQDARLGWPVLKALLAAIPE